MSEKIVHLNEEVIVEEHIPCHKRGVYGKERDNAG